MLRCLMLNTWKIKVGIARAGVSGAPRWQGPVRLHGLLRGPLQPRLPDPRPEGRQDVEDGLLLWAGLRRSQAT
eukprot:6043426-Alexandrium_andersonii.AAC.1